MNITLQDCQDLDAHDPLRGLRKHFTLAESTIYLDGNSLGAMPAAAPARVAEVVSQERGADLIQSWNKAGWFDLPDPVAGAEDFSYVLEEVPGAYVFVAAAPPELDPETAAYNHSAQARFADDAVLSSAALLAGLALDRLAEG